MTKKDKAMAEAVAMLRQWGVVDGTTIYGKVNHVSSSGMSRNIGLYVAQDGGVIDISYWAAKALGWPYKDGYKGGVRVSGCGMDMIFHTVYTLSYVMGYGDMCQTRDDETPHEKRGMNGETITAIGLKYRQL